MGSVTAAKWLLFGLVTPLAVAASTGAAGRWGAPAVLGVSGWLMIGIAGVVLVYGLLRWRSVARV